MNNDRQKILADYVSYLFTTRRTYDTIGKYIKYVTDFLESAEDINRRSYMAYKRENANIGARYPLMSEAICDLLHHLKIGYNRKDQKIKTLERLDAISEKNRRLLNDFIVWLTDSNECYELMPENREFLHTLSNVILLDEDFTKNSVGSYTKIIANPPFCGNQDIEHVKLMYERLEEGGTLAAITSQHWRFASEKKCIDFRNWLKEVHGEVFEISAGEFKESGTSISTMAVVIKNNSNRNRNER